MINKKAQMDIGRILIGMAIFFIVLIFILFVGFIMVTGSAVTNYVFDEVVPELTNLGQVGDANMTHIASFTIAPLNSIVQQFTWVTGVLYILMLVGSVGIAFGMRMSPSKWLIGFYLLLMIVLIFTCILISNIYEEFYTGTDDLAIRLQEHVLLSYMILYSPMIFTIIGFITGIIMFSGIGEEL